MKVRVDPDKCLGHGMCAALIPSLFAVDEDSGVNEMGDFEVADERLAEVRRGVSGCPEQAISILE